MKGKGKSAKAPRRAAAGRAGAGRAGAARAAGKPAGTRPSDRVLRAGDLMTRDPVLVHDDITVGELCDLFQEKNINGAPVIDRQGRLVGVVAQDDIIYGAMGHPDRSSTQDATRAAGVPGPEPDSPDRRRSRRVAAVLREQKLHSLPDAAPRRGETPFWAEERRASDPLRMPVGAIMTSPAISAEESTPVADLCEVMWNLRIHRVPIVNQGKVSGIVSSMDLCRAILSGLIKV